MTKRTKPKVAQGKHDNRGNQYTPREIRLIPKKMTSAQLAAERERLGQTLVDMLSDGATIGECAEAIGVPTSTISRLRAKYPDFSQVLDSAAFDGSVHLLEKLLQTPELEACPQRARVKIDAIRTYLEMRWPSRYGKRHNVEVTTIDLTPSIERARQRAQRVIESTAYKVLTTDTQSVCTEEAAPDCDAVDTFEDLL